MLVLGPPLKATGAASCKLSTLTASSEKGRGPEKLRGTQAVSRGGIQRPTAYFGLDRWSIRGAETYRILA